MFKTIHYMALMSMGILSAIYYLVIGADPLWWISAGIAYFAFSCLGVTITFHRYLAHNSFKFRFKWMEKLCILFGTLGGTGSAIAWVAVHRKHHRHSDTDQDPHTPMNGVKAFLMPNYDQDVNYRLVKRMLKDPYLHFMHKHAVKVFAAFYLVLFLLGGWHAVVFLGFIPQAGTSLMSVIISWSTHTTGYKNFAIKDNSRNTWWLTILAWGENWHNNHHAKPRLASFQYRWWELDISGLVIKLIGKDLVK